MEATRLKYPIGEQNFQSIRDAGKVYIDKTKLIYNLVNEQKYVFLSRPRRFGKSLLLSTIQAYFEGKKELFEGLEISRLEKDWIKYPVFHLELSRIDSYETDSLVSILSEQFQIWEKNYEVDSIQDSLGARFSRLIRTAHEKTGRKVVILVDEYDNPLINTLHREDIHEKNRTLLKSIYSNLKGMDEYIRFGMLSGVSRFSKMTIFSGLNNLKDISFSEKFSAICGFTEDEIKKYLWSGVENIADKLKISSNDAIAELKKAYDGYHFSEECPDLYNPFSLLNALDEGKIESYWISTATPSFLAERLKISSTSFKSIFNSKASERTLSENDTAFSDPVSLLYQTGYLTIKGYDKETKRYVLGLPNREVDEGLFNYLFRYFSGNQPAGEDICIEMKKLLKEGKPEEFLSLLQIFLAEVPYDIIPKVTERYFENTMYLLFRTMGVEVAAEKRFSFGRSDLIVFTDKYIYIFELKLDGSAADALKQIDAKGYALPYANDPRHLFKIGLNFSSQSRNLADSAIS